MTDDARPSRPTDAAEAARDAATAPTPAEWARGDDPHPDEPRYSPREDEAAAADDD